MPACPTCGEENPERARFCWSCGAAIAEAPRSGAEERKIVSVLFVDLVGFTSASEKADPEDVRARLRLYHARVKQEIERFGGTVEKFVGDAVMAVFGAPVSPEDDAGRAIAPRRRFGVDVEPIVRTPLIGRDDDLALLQSIYTRTLRDASVQLVTVTGEPGVGKTRLLAEFRKWVDDRRELVFWRQGRSLSYGAGITYWALGEMVKAQAGILESGTPSGAP